MGDGAEGGGGGGGGGVGIEEKTEIKVVSFTSRIEAHLDIKRGVLVTR